nr:high mobility group B protein 15-like [Ipomoea batatas]GME07539.1 high mobility group B protein 15-like [Ipomoea batatas]
MESSSTHNSPIPLREVHPNYYPYPPPLATYQDVVASPQLFMDTLQRLHASLGTKFMIPVIGGKYLDLHRLFVEVTSRGGFSKVLGEKRWKEVTTVFNFPSSATNASFILRKYYASLLHHYERIYYFNAKCWTPSSADALQNVAMITAPPCRLAGTPQQLPDIQADVPVSQTVKVAKETVRPPAGSEVYGVIDGKFESGYLVTVKIGSEDFKGVLYAPPNSANQVQQHQSVPQMQIVPVNSTDNNAASGVVRRKRRKKCEIKKRDPARPKPNRSGYNFFFQEQHARLKPLFPGKDREISRMIGEAWNKLNEPEKAIYQDKAIKDKERYRLELEDYQERLRTGRLQGHAAQMQQSSFKPAAAAAADLMVPIQSKDGNISPSEEDEASSNKSERSSSLEDHKVEDKGVDLEAALPGVETEIESATLGKGVDTVVEYNKDNNAAMQKEEISLPIHPMGDNSSVPS